MLIKEEDKLDDAVRSLLAERKYDELLNLFEGYDLLKYSLVMILGRAKALSGLERLDEMIDFIIPYIKNYHVIEMFLNTEIMRAIKEDQIEKYFSVLERHFAISDKEPAYYDLLPDDIKILYKLKYYNSDA